MNHSNIFFILVRPLFLGNIGSTARVLKNFGFENLRLVDPPKNYRDAEARRMAVGAFDLLKSSRIYENLKQALEDIDLVVGTTSGHQRACRTVNITELSDGICANNNARTAILFGEERDGLPREELERCHYIVSIPTAPDFPSLNVAQAAGIFAYELARAGQHSIADQESLANGAQTDEFFAAVDALLHTVGFTRSYNRKVILNELRMLFQKAKPSDRELALLHGALRKIERSLKEAPTDSEPEDSAGVHSSSSSSPSSSS